MNKSRCVKYCKNLGSVYNIGIEINKADSGWLLVYAGKT
jgi:hypothetical protein